jgi:arsenate reductase
VLWVSRRHAREEKVFSFGEHENPDISGADRVKTILFVYVHNAARSQMAQAFFNEMTEGAHLAISAGSQPADHVNPDAVKAMAEVGIDISSVEPKRLTGEMVERADVIVIMGCGENVCPVVPKEVIDWELEDPAGKPLEAVREIRDQIRERVRRLVEIIEKGGDGS